MFSQGLALAWNSLEVPIPHASAPVLEPGAAKSRLLTSFQLCECLDLVAATCLLQRRVLDRVSSCPALGGIPLGAIAPLS